MGGKRIVLQVIALLYIFAIFSAGCGSMEKDRNTTVITSTAVIPEKAPVIIYVPGDKPIQQEEVLEEIEKVTQGELNIDLTVNYINWGDYINQIKLKSTAGEAFDLYLNFFGEFSGAVAKRQCISLNELLEKYGQDLKAQIPQELWDGLTIEGRIYGIPAVYAMTEMGSGFLVRKDLREKYHCPEIINQATLEIFLDAIAKNEKDIIPYVTSGGADLGMLDREWIGHMPFKFGFDVQGYLYIDIDKKPYIVENIYKTELFRMHMEENRKAYRNGWFAKDCLTIQDERPLFVTGMAASMPGDLYNITERASQLAKNVPGAEIELAIINKDGRWINMTPVNNFCQISSTGKHHERAVMFMNWLRKSRDNYDLYMLGIKGKTYNLKGQEAELPQGIDMVERYAPNPWFTMHFPYLRTWTTEPKAFKDAFEFWKELKPEYSPFFKFAYSSEKVKAEKASVEKLIREKGKAFETGVLTSDAEFQEFLDELDRIGMIKIIEDAQKQVDGYLSK